MSKIQDKALDERNLHQYESQADGDEVEKTRESATVVPGFPVKDQRQDQKRQHCHNADGKDHEEHCYAQIDSPVHTSAGASHNVLENVASLEGKEEEGILVVNRRDVVGVRVNSRLSNQTVLSGI